MSISAVSYRPHLWSQAYNPIMWSIQSNQTSQPNFKYVFDLYVNGASTYTFRLKQNPNPAGYGMIDVSSFLQPYTDVDLYAPETTAYTNWYADSTNTVANVRVLAGEEYSVGGALTIFNGSGATGAPAYQLLADESGNSANQIRVLPAALPYEEATEIMTMDTTDYPFWSEYTMDGNGLFLKRQTGEISVYNYDCSSLAFLNWYDNGSSYNKAVQLAQFKQYDATGTLIRTDNIQNTTTAGGGPNTAASYTSQTLSRNFLLLYLQTGPANLDAQGIWSTDTAYYTVQLFAKTSATTSTTPGTAVSELVTYRLSDDCTNLYPRVRVSWLNDLGGRDYWNFTMFYEKTTNAPGETYQQSNYNYSGQYPVPVASAPSNTTINDKWLRGGNRSFNKVVQESYSIQTDWLTQDEVDFLAQIGQSPQVWIYVGEELTPRLVTITNVNYTYKLVKQTKLVQATYEMTYSKITKKQNI